MPFDAAPSDTLTVRQRRVMLRNLLDSIPDEKFDIRTTFADGTDDYEIMSPAEFHRCGTAACILGWAEALFMPTAATVVTDEAYHDLCALLGLTVDDADALFMPPGWKYDNAVYRYTRKRAVAALDHLIKTDEVSWLVAKP